MEKQVGDKTTKKIVPIVTASLLAGAIAISFVTARAHAQVGAWLIHKLYLMAGAGIILAAATAMGVRLLRALRLEPDTLSARIGFGAGIGLGILSLLTLLLGLLGVLHQIVFIVVIGAAALLFHGTLTALWKACIERFRDNWHGLSGYDVFIAGLIAIVFCMNLLGTLTPPWQYDDLEYHLGAPAQFWRQGRITFLEHNVYANFPANVEMWYLVGMILTKSPLQGALLGKLINLALGALTALMLWSLANRMFRKPAGNFAAAFFYVSPAVVCLSYLAHVEIALSFYIVLSIYGFILYQKESRIRWLILSAIACGLAFGCKYTAAAFLLLPLLIGVMICESASPEGGVVKAIKRAGIFLGITLLVVSPWLLKNLTYTGNPVYPLLWPIFGGPGWDAAKETMWREAHFAGDFSLTAFKSSAVYFFLDSEILMPIVAFVFIPFLILRGRKQPASFLLMGYFALCYLLWFCFSHRDARFLMPSASVLTVLSAGGLMQIEGRAVKIALAPLLLLCLVEADLKATKGGNFDAIFCFGADEQFFKDNSDFAAGYQASVFLNSDSVPPDAKILFVGEARTFYCERDFIAPTVFNDNVFENVLAESKTPADVLASLRAMGVTHLLINWVEIGRLHQTYRGAYARFDRSRFEAFEKACLSEVFRSQCPGSLITIYEIRSSSG